MLETNETHEKIIQAIKNRGPCLPIHLAKDLGISSLFISAFLAELSSEKRIKMSNLKVGGSKLYYLSGQEQMLENFYKYLHPKEIEAYLLLKEKKILKDSEQDPSIRVALRSIKDFSKGFKINDDIFWRYMMIPEQEAISLIKKNKKQEKIIKPKQISINFTEQKKPQNNSKTIQEQSIKLINPLAKPPEPKKQKPKSEFVEKTIKFIQEQGYKIIKEKDYKSKEYNCIVQVQTDLGPINFLTRAKDKKTITETDLNKLLSESQSIPLPALFLSTGNLSKKSLEYLNKFFSIIKFKKII